MPHAILFIDTEYTDQARRSLVAIAAVVITNGGMVMDSFEAYMEATARDPMTDEFWAKHPKASAHILAKPKSTCADASRRFADWVNDMHRKFSIDVVSDNPSMDVAAANLMLADANSPPINFRYARTDSSGLSQRPTSRTYRVPVVCSTTYEIVVRCATPDFDKDSLLDPRDMFPNLNHCGPKHTPVRDCHMSAQRYLYHMRRLRTLGSLGRFR